MFHARIVDYGYPTHCHDTWTLLIVDTGSISYDLDTRHCGASGETVAILPPGVPHNGKPTPGSPGFAKRVLYLESDFLPETLIGAAVDQTSIADPQLRRALVDLHIDLANVGEALQAESLLAWIGERVSGHLHTKNTVPAAVERGVARQLRRLLDTAVDTPMTLSEAASALDRSKAHLVRSFTAAYGVSPHAYVIGVRVEAARKLLLTGMPPAQAAVAAGFYDQSHLSRHFKRHISVPPGAYAASHRRRRSRLAAANLSR